MTKGFHYGILNSKKLKKRKIFFTNRIHFKKVTNSITIKEDDIDYLLVSDKFGEVYIKNLTSSWTEPPVILYGHSDPVHMLRISPFSNLIVSADTFGKIKVSEFPNIFNFLNVILYKNDEIRYLDFISNKELLVLTTEGMAHVWSMETFELITKFNIAQLINNDEIISIHKFGEKETTFYIETASTHYIVVKKEDSFKIKEKKHNDEKHLKFFIESENDKFNIIGIDADEKIEVLRF
jgi:WD40 repeat protein